MLQIHPITLASNPGPSGAPLHSEMTLCVTEMLLGEIKNRIQSAGH